MIAKKECMVVMMMHNGSSSSLNDWMHFIRAICTLEMGRATPTFGESQFNPVAIKVDDGTGKVV